MIFQYVRKLSQIVLIFFIFTLSVSFAESDKGCLNPKKMNEKIYLLNKKLQTLSKEYLIHYQSSSSDWVYSTYLFIGEYKGEYFIQGIDGDTLKSKSIITKTDFDTFYREALQTLDSGWSPAMKMDTNYCQEYFFKGSEGESTISINGVSSQSNVRKLKRKLESML